MRIDVVSIFPTYFDPLRLSLVGKAIDTGLIELGIHDLREWTHDRHRTVDDTPYGGGPGMVMRPEPWGEVLDSLAPSGAGEVLDSRAAASPTLIVPTPSGRPFKQQTARQLADQDHLIFA